MKTVQITTVQIANSQNYFLGLTSYFTATLGFEKNEPMSLPVRLKSYVLASIDFCCFVL